jgi:hypothetical protein
LRKYKIIFVLFVSLFIFGCINYEETVQLNQDGSGKLTMHYSIPQQLFAMMQMGQDSGEKKEEMPFKFKESEIKSDLTAPGVTVEKVEQKAEGDQQHFFVTLSFKKITDLNQTKSFAKMPFTWKEDGGNILFQQVLIGEKKEDESNPMGDQMASAMMGNAKFTFRVTLPSKALPAPDTNGTIQQDGKTVVWEYPILEASKGQTMTAKFAAGGLGLPISLPVLGAIGGGFLISIIALLIVIKAAKKM